MLSWNLSFPQVRQRCDKVVIFFPTNLQHNHVDITYLRNCTQNGTPASHLPPVTLVPHAISDLLESSNVGAHDERRQNALGALVKAVLGSDLIGGGKDALHDTLELVVDLLHGPLETSRVLSHLETRDGNTTAVGGLSGSIPDGVLAAASARLEDVDGLLCATHVGTLSDESNTGSDESLGLLLGDLVLGCARERNIGLADESPGALVY